MGERRHAEGEEQRGGVQRQVALELGSTSVRVTLQRGRAAYAATGGSSTISSQYLPSTFIASTNPENVTGFVMNELTPSR